MTQSQSANFRPNEQAEEKDKVVQIELELVSPREIEHDFKTLLTRLVERCNQGGRMVELVKGDGQEDGILRKNKHELSAERCQWNVEFSIRLPPPSLFPIKSVLRALSIALQHVNNEVRIPVETSKPGVLSQRSDHSILLLHDLGFFSRKIVSHYDRLSIRGLLWGVQLDAGTFILHHEVSYEPKTYQDEPTILAQSWLGESRARHWPTSKGQVGIALTVEWDRQRLFIHFVTREKNDRTGRQMPFLTRLQEDIKTFQLPLSDITRVVVDLAPAFYRTSSSSTNWQDGHSARLYLHTRTPTAVSQHQFVMMRNGRCQPLDRNKARFCRNQRFTRGRTSNECPYTEVFDPIATCNVLALDFSHDGLSDLYAVLSRLRGLCNIHVELATLETYDLHAMKARDAMLPHPLNPFDFIGAQDDYPNTIFLMHLRRTFQHVQDFIMDSVDYVQKRLNEEWITGKCPKEPALNATKQVRDLWLAQSQGPSAEFRLSYALEMLWSRGAPVIDQFAICQSLDDRYGAASKRWASFMLTVAERFMADDKLTLYALDEVVQKINQELGGTARQLSDIALEFDEVHARLMNDTTEMERRDADDRREGFIRMRKIVVTPTRVILMPSELMLSCRVMRTFDRSGDNFIRVVFRDDNRERVYPRQLGKKMALRAIHDRLVNGEVIAGRMFLWAGASNSQMRDAGAYFINAEIDLQVMWASLGKLDCIQPISKQMARMGQCFTQSRVAVEELDGEVESPIKKEEARAVRLMPNRYRVVADVEGGSAPHTHKAYIFTDGVGSISRKKAEELSRLLGYQNYCIPSCLQFRYLGAKGILVVNPALDGQWEFADRLGLPDVEDEHQKAGVRCDVELRPSQIKFDAPIGSALLEIVKNSGPTPLCLNRPLIAILSQIAAADASQNGWREEEKARTRIPTRIEQLADQQIDRMTTALFDEHSARDVLMDMPRRFEVKLLKLNKGFRLTKEPFFRSLLLAAFHHSIRKEMKRMNIAIDTRHGRAMFGVTDETGQLQYGQVFVQYTRDARIRQPAAWADRCIHTGPVLLTKFPCVVAGDVRMFEAVDIPELHHLCDVVVFSQHGPRSQPDEMAGSDLDGDEYAVIWDERLFFGRNHPAFTALPAVADEGDVEMGNVYSPSKSQTSAEQAVSADDEMHEMLLQHLDRADFYFEYLNAPQIGVFASAQLCAIELYGLEAKVTMSLADKCTRSVDFQKSGISPEPLTTEWGADGTPPERADRVPDYMEKTDKPSYRSNTLIGRLYRTIQGVDDVVQNLEEQQQRRRLKADVLYPVDAILKQVPHWETACERVKLEMDAYNSSVKRLMQAYGIDTEAEILADAIVNIRNRLSDSGEDNGISLYNTNYMIQQQMKTIWNRAREEFFEEFGGLARCSEYSREVHATICVNATEEMRAKAVCCLRLAYHAAEKDARVSNGSRQQQQPILLSFGWIAYDVLALIKQEHVLANPDLDAQLFKSDTIVQRLDDMIIRLIRTREEAFRNFQKYFLHKQDAIIVDSQIPAYYWYYLSKERDPRGSLIAVGFWLDEWARSEGLLTKEFRSEHLQAMLILGLVGKLTTATNDKAKSRPETRWMDEKLEPIEKTEQGTFQVISMGAVLLTAIQTLRSAAVRRAKEISFEDLGMPIVLGRKEWVPMSEAAGRLFVRLALENDDSVDGILTSTDERSDSGQVQTEMLPFAFEFPEGLLRNADTLKAMKQVLKGYSGTEDIDVRHDKNNIGIVSALGTRAAAQRLRQILTPSIEGQIYSKESSDSLAIGVARRLHATAQKLGLVFELPAEYLTSDEKTEERANLEARTAAIELSYRNDGSRWNAQQPPRQQNEIPQPRIQGQHFVAQQQFNPPHAQYYGRTANANSHSTRSQPQSQANNGYRQNTEPYSATAVRSPIAGTRTATTQPSRGQSYF